MIISIFKSIGGLMVSFKKKLVLSTCLVVSLSVMGQEKKKSTDRILFILDASHSMQGEWKSGSKINIAKKLLSNLLDSLASLAEYKDLEIGLRIYGNKSHYQIISSRFTNGYCCAGCTGHGRSGQGRRC